MSPAAANAALRADSRGMVWRDVQESGEVSPHLSSPIPYLDLVAISASTSRAPCGTSASPGAYPDGEQLWEQPLLTRGGFAAGGFGGSTARVPAPRRAAPGTTGICSSLANAAFPPFQLTVSFGIFGEKENGMWVGFFSSFTQRTKVLQAPKQTGLISHGVGSLRRAQTITCSTVRAFLPSCVLVELVTAHPWGTPRPSHGGQSSSSEGTGWDLPQPTAPSGTRSFSTRSDVPLPAAESSFCCFKHLFPISKIRLVRKNLSGLFKLLAGFTEEGRGRGRGCGFP